MTPQQSAAWLRQKSQAVQNAIIAVEKQTLIEAQAAAVALSSGAFSSKTLAAMGHPYSVRDPKPPADPGIINAQTGLLRRSWKKVAPRVDGDSVISELVNTAPYAGFMLGTRRMIPRPIVRLIYAAVAARRMKRLRKAISDALKG